MTDDPICRTDRPRGPSVGGSTGAGGAVTIDGDKVERNPAYYVIAHASRFVRPGSIRVATNEPPSLPNVAFRTPRGQTALIVLNEGREARAFGIRDGDRWAEARLPGGAVGTYVWP